MTPSRLIGGIRKAVKKTMPARNCFGIAVPSRNPAGCWARQPQGAFPQPGVDDLTGILFPGSSDSGRQVNANARFALDIASFF
jgi:hypothetical protein